MIVDQCNGNWRAHCESAGCSASLGVSENTLADAKRLLRTRGWSFGPGDVRDCVRCPEHADPGSDGEVPESVVHYGTLTENACNQDHRGQATQRPELVTCPRCLEVLAAKTETVDHPAHYGGASDPFEAIKVIEAWDLNFHLGNAVKYIARAGKKGDALEDLRKAAWYLQREIERRARDESDRDQ